MTGKGDESGIALMVVMVVFIILYLVVFQLHYATKLEEKLSRARAADAQGSAASRSMAYKVMASLAEDYQRSRQSASSGGAATVTGPTGSPDRGAAGAGAGAGADTSKRGASAQSSAGSDPIATSTAGGTAAPGWFDYPHKDIFLVNVETLNNISIKIRMIDNERGFNLNLLWDYAPSQAETLSETNRERAEKDQGQGGGTSDTNQLVNDIVGKKDTKQQKKTSSRGTTSSSTKKTGGAAGAAGAEGATASEETAELEWTPPTEERRQETIKMLQRAIDLMYRLNVENGFDYKVQPPQPQILAEAIERYVYQRRSQTFQSYIHLLSELINVLTMLGASPEVYYGPAPELRKGDEFVDRNQNYRYQKDEYGDLEGEYLYAEGVEQDRELMREQLAQLQSVYGQFESFPELGRMGNPMTRNTRDPVEVEDDKGNVSLAIPPMPIGLKDIFCTFSTGKINLNTAPVPVLYALLSLIIETEPDGELKAQGIALNIETYRNTFQPEYDDQDPTSAERKAASSGAPHRQLPQDGTGGTGRSRTGARGTSSRDPAGVLAASGAAAAAGLTPEELAAATEGGATDSPTNYFTNLNQLKLIDGEDGGRDDYLTEQGSATTTENLEQKSPLQKVLHDYGAVMVFGSTYFTATLKSKAEDSPSVKTGYLTILRDVQKGRMEVVQWKELQR